MEAVLLTLLAIALLLVLSALLSGSETALTAASRAHMHQLEREGSDKAKLVNQLREHKERMIGALLVGNNAVNILASALATGLSIDAFGDSGVIFATLVLTPLVVVFAEITPKIYALSHADRCALRAASPVRVVVLALSPVTDLLQGMAQRLIDGFQSSEEGETTAAVSKTELRGAVELLLQEEQEERAMIRSILDLRDMTVGEIMTHRKNVMALDIADPQGCVRTVLCGGFSRLPVCEGNLEKILGVVRTKDLFRSALSQGSLSTEVSTGDIMGAINPAWFIPEVTSLFGQLQAFRQRREHFALVVDEYGGLKGIITLEDILEVIVGPIEDEHDPAPTLAQVNPDGSYLVSGGMTIRDFNRDFDWSLPDDRASTLAGLVLRESRCIPDEGQIFTFYDFRFEIVKRNRYQLSSLRVTPPGRR